jgi:hypothetical protein
MGGMFKKPKVPDTSAQMNQQLALQEKGLKMQEEAAKKQEAILEKQEARTEAQETEKTKQLTSRRRAYSRGGSRALLSTERSNAEMGLAPTQDTLGVTR